jgi:hypothetical protein
VLACGSREIICFLEKVGRVAEDSPQRTARAEWRSTYETRIE